MKKIYFKNRLVVFLIYFGIHTGSVHSKPAKRKVIIIGAGISGLATARQIKKMDPGVDLIILEAKDRIGGRAYTLKKEPFAIDLGASWIHGIKNNPIYNLAQKLDLELLMTNDSKRPLTYLDSPEILTARERSKLDAAYEKFITSTKPRGIDLADYSLASAFRAFFTTKNQSFSKVYSAKLRHVLVSETENDFGTEAENISYKYWDSGSDFGQVNALIKDGMINIVDSLAQGLKISLNQKVTEINWHSSQPLKIKTKDKTYTADQVVITTSIGSLKKNQINFVPALPAWKKDAIARIGFGQFSKVFLVFHTAFWPNNHKWIENMGSEPHLWPMFLNLSYFISTPALVALHVGEQARRIDALSDEALKIEVVAQLKKIWGEKAESPVQIYRSNWSQDPESFGAYSYPAVGSTPEDYDLVEKTLKNTVFFAGEATSSEHSSTIHAAYLSGIKTAKKILKN